MASIYTENIIRGLTGYGGRGRDVSGIIAALREQGSYNLSARQQAQEYELAKEEAALAEETAAEEIRLAEESLAEQTAAREAAEAWSREQVALESLASALTAGYGTETERETALEKLTGGALTTFGEEEQGGLFGGGTFSWGGSSGSSGSSASSLSDLEELARTSREQALRAEYFGARSSPYHKLYGQISRYFDPNQRRYVT